MFPNATFMKEPLKIQDIPSNSCILIDDYILNRIDRLEMQKIIHYHLRHRNIAMILVIHTLHLSGIYSELLNAPQLLLTQSLNSKHYLEKIHKEYPDFFKAYCKMIECSVDEQYRVLYINKIKNYALILNIDQMNFIPEKMFYDEKMFVIHPSDGTCDFTEKNEQISYEIPMYIKEMLNTYKQKRKPQLLVNYLFSKKLISEHCLMVGEPQGFSYTLHLFDFIQLILSNNYLKNTPPKIDSKTKNFLHEFSAFSQAYPKSIFPKHILKYMS